MRQTWFIAHLRIVVSVEDQSTISVDLLMSSCRPLIRYRNAPRSSRSATAYLCTIGAFYDVIMNATAISNALHLPSSESAENNLVRSSQSSVSCQGGQFEASEYLSRLPHTIPFGAEVLPCMASTNQTAWGAVSMAESSSSQRDICSRHRISSFLNAQPIRLD